MATLLTLLREPLDVVFEHFSRLGQILLLLHLRQHSSLTTSVFHGISRLNIHVLLDVFGLVQGFLNEAPPAHAVPFEVSEPVLLARIESIHQAEAAAVETQHRTPAATAEEAEGLDRALLLGRRPSSVLRDLLSRSGCTGPLVVHALCHTTHAL